MQKVHDQVKNNDCYITLSLDISIRFQVLCTPFGFFFTFPSQYLFPIGHQNRFWILRVVPQPSNKVTDSVLLK